MTKSVYDFTCTTLDGREQPLATYRGSCLLVVNTASKCGLTPQYAGLEALYQKYHSRGLEVFAFHCNQFMKQEPGDEAAIGAFCSNNYRVSFPLFAKIEVNGPGTEPLFDYLKTAAPGLLGSKGIKWNFNKFLVDQKGQVVKRFAPTTRPARLESAIQSLLS